MVVQRRKCSGGGRLSLDLSGDGSKFEKWLKMVQSGSARPEKPRFYAKNAGGQVGRGMSGSVVVLCQPTSWNTLHDLASAGEAPAALNWHFAVFIE